MTKSLEKALIEAALLIRKEAGTPEHVELSFEEYGKILGHSGQELKDFIDKLTKIYQKT